MNGTAQRETPHVGIFWLAQALGVQTEATAPAEPLRWGTERRLEFIDFRLYWEGRVNRADLTREFGISVPQASST